jgi:hypothetical protein
MNTIVLLGPHLLPVSYQQFVLSSSWHLETRSKASHQHTHCRFQGCDVDLMIYDFESRLVFILLTPAVETALVLAYMPFPYLDGFKPAASSISLSAKAEYFQRFQDGDGVAPEFALHSVLSFFSILSLDEEYSIATSIEVLLT